MRQVVLERPRVITIREAPHPEPGPGQALVQLRKAGICGSDLSAYRGTSPHIRYPCVLGHELLVDVIEAPDSPDLAGRRAVVEPLLSCGTCRACRVGRYNCCVSLQTMGVHTDGGLRDLSAVPVNRLHPVPDSMTDDLAVLAEPTSIAYRAVQRSAAEAGQIAVVFGAGTIGLLIATLMLRGRGCRVMVVDIDPWRLGAAEALGALPIQGAGDVVSAVREATGGEMADVVFEATGSAACTRMATEVVAHCGRIVLVGWNKGPVEFDTVTLMRKEADVVASRNSTGAFPPVLRLLADGIVDPAQFVTHRFHLTGTASALALLDEGRIPALKILIDAGS